MIAGQVALGLLCLTFKGKLHHEGFAGHARERAEDYLRRFPKQADQLRRMFTIQPGQTTTMAVGNRRPPVDVGKQIDDFDVLLRLGEGAFASVYLARQRSMQRMSFSLGSEAIRWRIWVLMGGRTGLEVVRRWGGARCSMWLIRMRRSRFISRVWGRVVMGIC